MALTKPTGLVGWCTTGTRVEPGAPKRLLGWVTPEKPPDNFFNQLFGITGDFLEFYNERIDDGFGAGDGVRLQAPAGSPYLDLNGATNVVNLVNTGSTLLNGAAITLSGTSYIYAASPELRLLDLLADSSAEPVLRVSDVWGGVLPGPSNDCISLQGPLEGHVFVRLRSIAASQASFRVVADSAETGAVDFQDRHVFVAYDAGNCTMAAGLQINTDQNATAELYFNSSAGNTGFLYENALGENLTFLQSGNEQVEFRLNRGDYTYAGDIHGAFAPINNERWELGTDQRKFRAVKARELFGFGDEQTPSSQRDLAARHANNAILARGTYDVNTGGALPAVGKTWNCASIVEDSPGTYTVTLDESVGSGASVIVSPHNVSGGILATGYMPGANAVQFALRTASTGALITGNVVVSITVVGGPQSYT